VLKESGWWPRPLPSKLGLRPNSVVTATRGGVEEAARVEVGDEGGEGAVEFAAAIFHALGELLVHVPAAALDLDEADAVLDQPPREEAALAEFVPAILVARRGGLGAEVERLEVGALHERHRGVVEIAVRFHVFVAALFAEGRVELREQADALLLHVG